MKKRSRIKADKFFDIAALAEAGPYCKNSIYKFIRTRQLKAHKRGKLGKYHIKETNWFSFLNGVV